METTAWQLDHGRAFHYGFLSSRASEALWEYLDRGAVSADSVEPLRHASDFLEEMVTAQHPLARKDAAAPTESALDAFRCAFEVIAAHRTEFGVRTWPELIALVEQLRGTLAKMLAGAVPSRPDVELARSFFRHLAEMMLAQVSVPDESPTSL